MNRHQKRSAAFWGGLLGAFLIVGWWHSEVASRVGDALAEGSLNCLITMGAGSCAQLWWIGLHQENQIASVLFYVAAGVAVWALLQGKDFKKEDERIEKLSRWRDRQ